MIDYGTWHGLTRCVNGLVGMNKPDPTTWEPRETAMHIMEEIRTVEMCWVAMAHDDTNSEPELLRVQVNPDNKFDIVDFTTARRSGRLLFHNVPQEDIPTWIIEAISILRIADERSPVHGVGFKVSDKLYYIVDKRGENEQS